MFINTPIQKTTDWCCAYIPLRDSNYGGKSIKVLDAGSGIGEYIEHFYKQN